MNRVHTNTHVNALVCQDNLYEFIKIRKVYLLSQLVSV